MKRAGAIWAYSSLGQTLTDITAPLGQGRQPVVLAPGDRLYVGHEDWLAGLVLFILQPPSGVPNVVAEVYDGETDSWVTLPTVERYDNLETDYSIDPQGFTFQHSGMLQWNVVPALWQKRLPDPASGFPEAVPLPTQPQNPNGAAARELFWVRLNNLDPSISLQINRLLPSLYNTYTTVEKVARFIGMEDFDQIAAPLQDAVRERIREQEDILDDFMRSTYRFMTVINERDFFNPYGQKLIYTPVLMVTRLGVWTGSNFQTLVQGRNQDYYLDPPNGMVYYTRISLGRGLPWSRAASRYLRQPASAECDYIAGGDFDLAPKRGVIQDVVNMRVAQKIAMMQDWISYFVSNPDAVPKQEKVREWAEASENLAAQIRGMLVA